MDDLIRRGETAMQAIKELPSVELPIKEKCCVCPHCDNCDVNEDGTIERKKGEWIPCSERLPEEDGEYLVWMQWNFEEEPSYSIVNYDANAEAFGEWHEYFDSYTMGSLGSDFRSFERVFAWMPLPEPYEEEKDERI